jgi:hypothetical protein
MVQVALAADISKLRDVSSIAHHGSQPIRCDDGFIEGEVGATQLKGRDFDSRQGGEGPTDGANAVGAAHTLDAKGCLGHRESLDRGRGYVNALIDHRLSGPGSLAPVRRKTPR